MDLKQALAYPARDSKWWLKCIIAFFLCLTVIGSPFVVGYCLRLAKLASQNNCDGLMPEWDDWGGLFMDGLRVMGMQLGYSLPAIVVMFAGIFLGGGLAMITNDNSGAAAGGGMLIMFAAMGIGLLLIIPCAFLMAVAYLFLMQDAPLGECFALGRVMEIAKANLGSIFMFIVFSAILNIVANVIGQLTMGIGAIIATPYALFATSILYAQLSRILAHNFDKVY